MESHSRFCSQLPATTGYAEETPVRFIPLTFGDHLADPVTKKPPAVAPRPDFGQPDAIGYERIRHPALALAGGGNELRLPGCCKELS
jgi:hypothetical protein